MKELECEAGEKEDKAIIEVRKKERWYRVLGKEGLSHVWLNREKERKEVEEGRNGVTR